MKLFALIAICFSLAAAADDTGLGSNATECVLPCPYMPVNPRRGQRSGFAAYRYDGSGPNTPEHWPNLDCVDPPFNIFAGCSYCKNECGGKVQSPVDVIPSAATTLSWIPKVELNPSTCAMMRFKMASGSYKMECEKPGTCGSVMLGDEKYDMLQVHAHQHSEHAINGKLYPAEIHVVHVRGRSKLLVVGVLFEVGESSPGLQRFIDCAKNETLGELNVAGLVGPAMKKEHLTLYHGSLTTPPCSEGVRWAVSSKIMTASPEQIKELNVMAGCELDARPVQPMNGRPFFKF